ARRHARRARRKSRNRPERGRAHHHRSQREQRVAQRIGSASRVSPRYLSAKIHTFTNRRPSKDRSPPARRRAAPRAPQSREGATTQNRHQNQLTPTRRIEPRRLPRQLRLYFCLVQPAGARAASRYISWRLASVRQRCPACGGASPRGGEGETHRNPPRLGNPAPPPVRAAASRTRANE